MAIKPKKGSAFEHYRKLMLETLAKCIEKVQSAKNMDKLEDAVYGGLATDKLTIAADKAYEEEESK